VEPLRQLQKKLLLEVVEAAAIVTPIGLRTTP